MANYTDVATLVNNAFVNTEVLGMDIVIPAIVIFLCVLLISRDKNSWGELALPMTIGWKVGGLIINPVLFIVVGMWWLVSTSLIGKTTQFITSMTSGKHEWKVKRATDLLPSFLKPKGTSMEDLKKMFEKERKAISLSAEIKRAEAEEARKEWFLRNR